MKYVPELEEERFQSMVAVPILARDRRRDRVSSSSIPRRRASSTTDVLNFLVHTASLVAGAIENAQLFEETRRRVAGAHHAHAAEPGAGRGHPARGPLRRGHARRPPAARRRRLPDLAPRRRRRRAGCWWASDPQGAPAPARGPAAPPCARPDAPRSWPGEAGASARELWPESTRTRCWSRRWWPATSSSAALLHRPRARVRRRGRGAARRRRQPDGGRPEEGRADRAPHGGEHRQGHVRRARRRLGRGRGGEGERGAVRPQSPPPLPPRRAARGAERGRSLMARARRSPGGSPAAPLPARVLRLPARPACGPWLRCRRRAPRRSSGCAQAARRWRRDEGVVVGLSDVDRGAASARRRMREAADAARIGRSLVAEGGAVVLRAARRLPLPRPP